MFLYFLSLTSVSIRHAEFISASHDLGEREGFNNNAILKRVQDDEFQTPSVRVFCCNAMETKCIENIFKLNRFRHAEFISASHNLGEREGSNNNAILKQVQDDE